jgi:outer membrane receptor protein involved in Fe transport
MLSLLLAAGLAAASDSPTPTELDAIHVTGRAPRAAGVESVTQRDGESVARIAPTHPNELLQRFPGAWISRGSGQEQLTAIRSPVLTGPGACGAFLWLEDGIPIRPAGFCNVNQLFELDTVQVDALELLRGPGSAVHGSNALHGAINVRTPLPGEHPGTRVAFDAGAHTYARIRAAQEVNAAAQAWRLEFGGVGGDSFRDAEGVDQQSLRAAVKWLDVPGTPLLRLSAVNLNQETAGFVSGENAYRDARRRSNENPEAFRDARAFRLNAEWHFEFDGERRLLLRPYARRDDMRFLQHFLLGKPLEENGSHSLGLQAALQGERLNLGVDAEWAEGYVLEDQATSLTEGSALQQAIRPAGRHFDYRAHSSNLAAFVQWRQPLNKRWRLESGARIESLAYDYDNRMAAGNLREDGTPCTMGGCLFNRPADRHDRFGDWNAQIGLVRESDAYGEIFGRLARAFRFPQAAELYRLQRGQDVADLDSERLDGIELGWRQRTATQSLELAAYHYDKRRVILRDAQGFNISDGHTTHRGIELDWRWTFAPTWRLEANAAYSIQRYAFDRALGGGETIVRGNEVDSAPRWLGGARLAHEHAQLGEFELEWVHLGGYYLDAANTQRYPGHHLLHLRWQRSLSPHWSVSARLLNLADQRYAERADLGFGQFRYFPGAGRSLFLGLAWQSSPL